MKYVNYYSKKAFLFIFEVVVILGLMFNNIAPVFAQAAPNPAQPNHALAAFTDCNSVSGIPALECAALVALYNSTGGPSWTHHIDWLQTDTPCSWYGVVCSGVHVIGITFHNIDAGSNSNNLSGSLPHELGNLTYLIDLTFNGNHLSGSIPPELGNLTKLNVIWLNDNQLSGSIPPQLGNLTDLTDLELFDNQLSGSLPPELGNLTKLQNLALYLNQLSGSIPPQLGNLTNLKNLQIELNQLRGSIPVSLKNLTKLTYFYFASLNSLCEPADTGFQTWLNQVYSHDTAALCSGSFKLYLPLVSKGG